MLNITLSLNAHIRTHSYTQKMRNSLKSIGRNSVFCKISYLAKIDLQFCSGIKSQSRLPDLVLIKYEKRKEEQVS